MDDEQEQTSDPVLREVIGSLRRPVDLGDRAIAKAMGQLRSESRRRGWIPHPGWAAALAASLVLVLFGAREFRHSTNEGVTFALAAPAAERVAVIGDFNDWNPDANPLAKGTGQWSVTLKLKPGRYRYSFVVNGSSWRADPRTPAAEDDFGTPTSVITVAN